MKKAIILLIISLMSCTAISANGQNRISRRVTQSVYVQTQPSGVHVYLDGNLVCVTPGIVKINKNVYMPVGKKKEDEYNRQRAVEAATLSFRFIKDGYQMGEEVLIPDINYDRKSRYLMVEYPKELSYIMQEDPRLYQQDNSIPAGEAKKAVNRDNPGATALEKTIIRWYFESQPQGARIFWRVISSCPDQVKNTNEVWLGSTPFEETRSFNIPGLTYENSRDVQIEIKVRRNGYVDQTKRFNVRQAIDQQEISSFFDMIKIEEE